MSPMAQMSSPDTTQSEGTQVIPEFQQSSIKRRLLEVNPDTDFAMDPALGPVSVYLDPENLDQDDFGERFTFTFCVHGIVVSRSGRTAI